MDYYNLSFGLATKAKTCDGAGQEGSLGVTFHAPGSARNTLHAPKSARECERMNPHTPK
jgi:hypothetical protein